MAKMIMDLIVLGIFVLTLVVCIIRGFALTLIEFLKGIASWVCAWIFCDDLSAFLLTETKMGTKVAEKISAVISEKVDASNILNMMPKILSEEGLINSSKIINDTSEKLAHVVITVFSFFLIAIILLILLSFVASLLKHRNKDSLASSFDRVLGIILGTALGLLYVYTFLALLIPVVGLIIPNQADTIMGWFEGSVISRAMYDNNLLIMLIKNSIL